ncbi:hypothetical protein MM239_18090 [Belliella sp. DSM 111904]|uniref:Uncharacterized protein n=1 Tax=Belliella filtrata TaxID=2923435 RepID=A0ABS9V4H1_9BACT|nr:hypothetical protein [Belliella filtrata]MCH7411311.1 hypothetical protein [Belliella filtrata]
MQLALVNISDDSKNSVQIGLVNLAHSPHSGIRLGIVNNIMSIESGLQIGLVNNAKYNLKGTIIGLFNTGGQNTEGFHLGLVNLTDNSSKGLRFELFNQSNNHEGLMIGLVNKADSLNGKAIGLFNLLKQDAFLTISVNYHFDQWAELQFKSGIEQLYGIISYHKELYNFLNSNAIGYGLGTRIPFTPEFLISSELLYHSQIKPYWKFESVNNDKFYAYINFVIPVTKKLEIVFAKNIHYS